MGGEGILEGESPPIPIKVGRWAGSSLGSGRAVEESAKRSAKTCRIRLFLWLIFPSCSSTKTSFSSRLQPPLFPPLRRELMKSHVRQKKGQ